ncbi:MAG: hypothetical protein IJO71_09290 [Microbacterium sp.]|uniref:hypothetical protein n=1 Tax=Microbacterium sp. TaxID=51671 RepID=UPI0025DD081A|nr:hypothetical protein [Microbacterium sp.]MBQ9917375.1 hypothetical protein [Microbacterium sp.]
MSAMGDFALEVAERIAGVDGDVVGVVEALMDGRVEFGALGPSGRIWVSASRDAVLEIATAPGMGMVARLDGGAWVTIRQAREVPE